MFICKRVHHLKGWLDAERHRGHTIGFVPTMGALHEGHLSLVTESRLHCTVTAVSIFVNPRQFNNPSDLTNYPRPLDSDLKALLSAGADVVFVPDVADMYPARDPFQTDFDPGILGETMEGKFRPGHFKGMADVVYRLLRIVEPNGLFLGQKDFQQAAIITKLVHDTHLPVRVTVCPTIREPNGLAMSSRNMRLSEQGKNNAQLIHAELKKGKADFEKGIPAEQIRVVIMNNLKLKGFDPEYVEVVDGNTLLPVSKYSDSEYVVACGAVNVEGIRLIDNLVWKKE